MPTTIVDTQTNEFVPSGHAADARYVQKTVPRNPDPATEKYSGNDANPISAKTSQEIADYKAAVQTNAATLTSREKTVLAIVAWVVRRTNNDAGIAASITAWNNASLTQKKNMVFAEADIVRDMYIWAENNL